MTARCSLVIGLGALLGVGWLLPLAPTPPNRLLWAHAPDQGDADAGPRLGEVQMDAPEDSPLRKKLRRHGFQFELEPNIGYVKDLITFQEVCDLLGCKVDDFDPPESEREDRAWRLTLLLTHDSRAAHTLQRKDFTCYVWVLGQDCRKDKDKLRGAVVDDCVWVHR